MTGRGQLRQPVGLMMRRTLTTLPLLGLLAMACTQFGELRGGDAAPGVPPRPYSERLGWWSEGRCGIFIHWGPVSLKGTEISWSRANSNTNCPNHGEIPVEVYDNLYKGFNPVKFDAKQWVSLAKAAGARYIVLTAKHCDGFLLWRSEASDYNISRTPFQRDICAELSSAARAKDMRIGWYFSPMDWRDPDFRTDRNPAFLGRMHQEIRELLGNYGRIDLLWFDWDAKEPRYDQARTYQIVKDLQPGTIINNRLDLGPENSDRQILNPNAEYYTPEQTVGAYDDQRPWESCMTTSRKNQWAWGGADDGVKTLDATLGMLIRCAGGDGNILLNIGPTPTGEIAPEQADLLRGMGAWLSTHGESIYGRRGGPFKPGEYGVSTRKGNSVYIHLLERHGGDKIKLPAIAARVLRGHFLGGGACDVRQTADGLEIVIPENARQVIDTIVVLELDRPALELASVAVAGIPSLATGAKATASNVYQGSGEFGPERAIDGNGDTRWATDSGVASAWLELDLLKPETVGRAVIKQAFPELRRVRKFTIEYWQDSDWRVCYRGTNLDAVLSVTFEPFTAQKVRLNITDAADGPTIFEFQLFKN